MNYIDYEKQATDFLKKYGTEIKIEFIGLKKNNSWNDKNTGYGEKRPLYEITLKNQRYSYTFEFWGSLYNGWIMSLNPNNADAFWYMRKKGLHKKTDNQIRILLIKEKQEIQRKKPTVYDVLACLTPYDVGNFEDFCAEFGYDADNRKAEKIYFAVKDEYNNLKKLFPAEALEELQEIN